VGSTLEGITDGGMVGKRLGIVLELGVADEGLHVGVPALGVGRRDGERVGVAEGIRLGDLVGSVVGVLEVGAVVGVLELGVDVMT